MLAAEHSAKMAKEDEYATARRCAPKLAEQPVLAGVIGQLQIGRRIAGPMSGSR
jgi:hypothetical protein